MINLQLIPNQSHVRIRLGDDVYANKKCTNVVALLVDVEQVPSVEL